MSVDSGRSSRSKIDRFLSPLSRFMAIEAASGAVLLVCAIIALVVANSAWSEPFARFWQIHLRIGLGSWELDESLLHWINDGLMTIFFFVVGLEIKREIVAGELRDPRKAALPLMAALGGMLAPAQIYVFMLRGEASGQSGWAIQQRFQQRPLLLGQVRGIKFPRWRRESQRTPWGDRGATPKLPPFPGFSQC